MKIINQYYKVYLQLYQNISIKIVNYYKIHLIIELLNILYNKMVKLHNRILINLLNKENIIGDNINLKKIFFFNKRNVNVKTIINVIRIIY